MKEPRLKGWRFIRLAPTIVGKEQLKELKKASKNGKESSAETLRRILTGSGDAEAFTGELDRRMRDEKRRAIVQRAG